MPSNAVTLAHASDARSAPTAADASSGAGRSRRRHARTLGPGRSYLVVFLLAVVGVWLVLVFGRALTELNEATEQAAALRAETAALYSRLEAGERELALVQGDAFQAIEARAYGLGGADERAFALEAGTPPPPPIAPLGSESPSVTRTPLEAWLVLLFGGP